MKLCSFVSGSNGNALFIQHKKSGILVDVGLSFRTIKDVLAQQDVDIGSLTGVLLTHEHSDHTKGLLQLAIKTGVPIYGKAETLSALIRKYGELMPDRFTAFVGEGSFSIGDFQITPFDTPHDVPSLGFRVAGDDGKCLAIATDLGHMNKEVYLQLVKSDLVYIEANYDEEMLRNGHYPYYLKERILSNFGHLSNFDCGETVKNLALSGTPHFILGHLSNNNNLPSLAMNQVVTSLMEAGIKAGEVTVDVAPRSERSKIFEL